MIAMLMRNENRVEIAHILADGRQAMGDLAAAQTGVDKNTRPPGLQECGVTRTAAG
jgi:crotonobetainyl-CoA:carnitine CoA-transferase CaiB-like acyl-CoA transferase